MENKVKLPREVAESIETLRSHDFKITNHDILFIYAESYNNGYPDLVKYSQNHFDTLLNALVNGYEIEETPEEKVKTTFEYVMQQINNLDDHPQVEHWKGFKTGIITTLASLNIKIKGVNDHE